MKSSILRRACHTPYLITISFIIFVTILYGQDLISIFRQRESPVNEPQDDHSRPRSEKELDHIEAIHLPFAVGELAGEGRRCDVFAGRWVEDEEKRPLYEEWDCPYIQPQLTCLEYGRPERRYQKWRWQPHGCSLPRFNATFMWEMLRGKQMMFVGDSLNRGQFVSMVCLLHSIIPENEKSMNTYGSLTVLKAGFNATFMWEMLRGKRMMFVGDSLNRGQFVSMVCLLHSIIPENEKSMNTYGSLTVLKAERYNASIEFYWAPFLVESNSDDAVVHRVSDRIVRLGSIKKHAKNWEGVDILVFNTYLWWMTGEKMKTLRGSFEDAKKDIVKMETEKAYRLALKSMAKWVDKHMDPHKTRVFFATMSPSHAKSEEWGGEPGGNCYNQTTPIGDQNYWGTSSSKDIMKVIGNVFSKMKAPITVINITQLSEYRKDAHTSIYKKQWSPLTPEQLANPVSYADCVHWCLPGLQDTWNELLYTKLFYL